MTTTPTTFDPAAFKTTTRAQWQSAAEPWHRWGPFIGSWLGAATDRMIEQAGIREGSRVLDVAAEAGEQSLTIARRVGLIGHVLATDIAPNLLERAAADAAAAGLDQVGTRELDGEELGQLDAGSFDAAVSRVGLIYFPDQARALAGIRHALREGGRASFVVYSTPDRNEFFSIPVRIVRGRAQLPPPLPGQPGPFSLGTPGVLPSAAECVRFERESFGALHQMMASLSAAEQAETWSEIESELARFEGPGGFEGPCEMLVGVGTR